ncbi:MAG: tetratricopeptide repeat protein [Magnetococcales bacterium]|nr:tetratricopeptide repeat protein [Magnetococcales bacterium]
MAGGRRPADPARKTPPRGAETPETLFPQALRHHQEGRLADAERLYRRILARNANHADAMHLLGVLAHQSGRHEAALEWIDKAIALHEDPLYLLNLGNILEEMGRMDEAIASFRQVLALDPDRVEAHFGLACALRPTDPEASCRALMRVIALQPGHAEAHYNLSVLYQDWGRYREALDSVRRALEIKPEFTVAHHTLGNLLRGVGRCEEALAAYERVVAMDPWHADAWCGMGHACNDLGRMEESIGYFRKACEARPDCPEMLGYRIHQAMHLCDWRDLDEHVARLLQRLQSGGSAAATFVLLPLPTTAGQQLACARAHVAREVLTTVNLAAGREVDPHPGRLRIGYFSGDFGGHPVARLVAPLFESHDRERFEVFVYSHGGDREHAMRQRIRAGCDRFVDVTDLSNEEAARRILDDGVHILVEMQGFTKGARLRIPALRPAPLVVSWLGYAGTLGSTRLADYLIGDPVATPPERAWEFDETLALLPNCYLPGDRRQPLSTPPERLAVGLPAEGFVFCSFNQSVKFHPALFDLWCRLLREVPGSVLWLRKPHPLAERHLRDEAARRGVDPDRLRFAGRLPDLEDHLARLALADLALDPFPYNSHATGLDALSCGVPMVTKAGETFAGRVGASLLHAAGLPELIACDQEDYFVKALELARDPERLRHIKERLISGRSCLPLFDCVGFTRDLERLYRRMWQNHIEGRREMIVPGDGAGWETHAGIPVPGLFEQALALHQAGRMEEAEPLYRRVLEADPRHADALHLLGMAVFQAGHLHEAVELVERAIASNDRVATYHCNLGVVYKKLDNPEKAVASYQRALAIEPDLSGIAHRMGLLLQGMGRHEEAEAAFRREILLEPGSAKAYTNLGNLLKEQERDLEAEGAFRNALRLDADNARASHNLALMLWEQRRNEEAEHFYREAVRADPGQVESHFALGLLLMDLNRNDAAREAFQRALDVRPDFAEACGYIVRIGMLACDWPAMAEWHGRLVALLQAGHRRVTPLLTQFLPIDPEEQRWIATAYGSHLIPSVREWSPSRRFAADPGRLSIGYFSGDFRNHPVAHQMAGLFARQDRDRFEVIVYSYGEDDGSQVRERIRGECDRFVDMRRFSDAGMAQTIREDGVHILVDLQGYTKWNRIKVLGMRPAPLQVTWLGYPGTLGVDRLADYLIGDPVATPPEHAAHFSETLALLPHCYLPNDQERRMAPPPTRREAGLPDEGFVFCSFNQSVKFNPESFDIWCRLFHAVPGSVLWLRCDDALAQANLCNEAQSRGIDPSRLVFSPRMPGMAEHLARLSLADLALDTFPYNSHSTGCDALWCGVPLLTRIGEGFQSRVGAGLLRAVGLPELITTSWEAYLALAIALARDPGRLRDYRQRLLDSRSTSPLFDTTRFTRNLERLYERMWRDWRAGKREMIVLDEDGEDASDDRQRG